MKRAIFWMAALTLMAAGALYAQTGAARGGSRSRAPVMDARDFNLEKYKGRVALVAFWKTGNEQNADFLPWLSRLQEDHGAHGLSVVAVNADPRSAAGADAVSEMHERIQIVLDPNERLVSQFEVATMPGAVLVDRGGGVRARFAGFASGTIDSVTTTVTDLVNAAPEAEADGKL